MDAVKAFDRLERSGGGFVVPLVVFCIGMVITVATCAAIRHLDEQIENQNREQQPLVDQLVVALSLEDTHVTL